MSVEQCWDVTITFADGATTARTVYADSRLLAFKLALIDSRMGSPFGTFYAPVASWDAMPTAMEEV